MTFIRGGLGEGGLKTVGEVIKAPPPGMARGTQNTDLIRGREGQSTLLRPTEGLGLVLLQARCPRAGLTGGQDRRAEPKDGQGCRGGGKGSRRKLHEQTPTGRNTVSSSRRPESQGLRFECRRGLRVMKHRGTRPRASKTQLKSLGLVGGQRAAVEGRV